MYFIEKNITRLENKQSTLFLDPNEQKQVQAKYKKKLQIYKPYKDSIKNILYEKKEPIISLYEIKSKEELKHQDILGAIYSLNIDKSLYGDIIIKENHYYIYVLPIIENYLESNLIKIKHTNVTIEKIDIDSLKEYELETDKLEILVSSTRIDTILSAITNINRKEIKEKIKQKLVLVNYQVLTNDSYNLKENDIFSIRKYGKYKYIGIDKITKKDHFIIKLLKYK